MKHHSHSHRERLRRRRSEPRTLSGGIPPAEIERQRKRRRRIERRELQKALGPREVVVRLPLSIGREAGTPSAPGWGRDSWKRRRALERIREREEAAGDR